MNGLDTLRIKRRLCMDCGEPVRHTGLLAWCSKCKKDAKKRQKKYVEFMVSLPATTAEK